MTLPDYTSYAQRLRGIRFQCHIGASLEERAVAQEILVDVDLELSTADLPTRDALDEVLSYDTVACIVVELGKEQHYRLLETYAQRVTAALLARTTARSVRVSVTKKHVPTTHPVDIAAVDVSANR